MNWIETARNKAKEDGLNAIEEEHFVKGVEWLIEEMSSSNTFYKVIDVVEEMQTGKNKNIVRDVRNIVLCLLHRVR